jgi:hypothetical protein
LLKLAGHWRGWSNDHAMITLEYREALGTGMSLGKHLEANLSRIQFTPDLLPSDVAGTEA